jgi:hypothetical protein
MRREGLARRWRARGFIVGFSTAAIMLGGLLSATPAAAMTDGSSTGAIDPNKGYVVSQNSGWDLTGSYGLVYSCTAGCSGSYPHTMNVTAQDSAGNFSGNGVSGTDPSVTWSVTGRLTGSSLSYHIVYTGRFAGYTVDATGAVASNGALSGTATGPGQQFTWFSISGTARPVVGPPAAKDECWREGWMQFNRPVFKNEGECVSFVAHASH